MTNITPIKPAPIQPDEVRVRVEDLTQSEIESLRRQNPELAERLHFPPIRYDNGIEPVGLSGVGHG